MYSSTNIDFEYKYRTISVEHLKELQEDIDKLRREGKLSDNEVYRSYIDTKKFEIPENLPNAKSIIILAIFSKLGLVNFHLDGKIHEIMIPPNYYDDGTTVEDFENLIIKDIIQEPGYKVELTRKLHIKLLAVRSGLGKYGRNNICYVDGWGSMINLFAFFTDFQFEEDNWTEIKMMDQCKNCTICINNCPTNAIPLISDENFVINAGKCISVYNEIQGIIPDWIPTDAHNALIGCMRCQKPCPSNKEVINLTEKLDDITENETKVLLERQRDEKLANSLSKKLKIFSPSNADKSLPVIKRNLAILVK
ncbi:MAG: 4Fe-4S double cluster binding domain-containing protein [Candidatus Lokiarchaeia archaeon]